MTAFAQNTRDEVRVQGDGTLSGALAAQSGMKQQTYIAECLTPWDVQSKRVFGEDGVAPTLPSGGTEGMTIQPLVMASGHSHAEIGVGGSTNSHGAQPARAAHTSNGEDVFPALCATDGSKQFIDNQSVRGGRLIIEQANSVQVQRGSGGEDYAYL